MQQIVNLLHDHSVFGVILSAKHTNFEQVEYVIRACELEGIEVWLIADFFSTADFPHQLRRTAWAVRCSIFRTTPEASWHNLVKQLMDFFGALILLVILSPLFLAIAAAIKLISPGPVFFQQKRSGLNGAPFTLYKFRTMVTNAEQFKQELAAMNEMTGPVFKVTNDPRVTPHREIPPQIQPRRTAAALQRPARRDEPGRPAPAAGGRGANASTISPIAAV